jgi:GNAT superfamily N-acetyltransferase
MTTTLRVREMRAGDSGAVAALSEELGYPAGDGDMAARIAALTLDGEAVLLVAETAAGDIAGWIHVASRRGLESAPFAEIVGLVVARTRRRQGAGRLLLRAGESWAAGRGLARIRVRSNVARDVAHAFYPAMGYRRVKTQHVYERAPREG